MTEKTTTSDPVGREAAGGSLRDQMGLATHPTAFEWVDRAASEAGVDGRPAIGGGCPVDSKTPDQKRRHYVTAAGRTQGQHIGDAR